MSTMPSLVDLSLLHPNEDWRRAHEELKTNDQAWSNLAFDGIQADGQGGLLENRRCPGCGSTLGRAISPIAALEVCQQVADVHARSLVALSTSLHMAQTKATRSRRSRS